tara:strand:- start:357 stop:998 length:642 start_codon:yes stop_codon:yes gene_type:complete
MTHPAPMQIDHDRAALVVDVEQRQLRSGESTRCVISEVASSLVHAALVSIFETIFFWSYVVPHERVVLLRYQDELGDIVSALCSDANGLLLAPAAGAYSFMPLLTAALQPEDNRTASNNRLCLRTSVHLSVLFCLGALAASLVSVRLPPQKPRPHTMRRILASCATSLISISMYEYMFFDLVVSRFQPVSTTALVAGILEECSLVTDDIGFVA